MDYKKLQNGSDIRGVALEGIEGQNVNLTEKVCKDIGRGFALWLIKKTGKTDLRVAVGRDSRLSGPQLCEWICSAMVESGLNITNFGMASTPAMFMSTIVEGYNFDGSIMITASHNPAQYNGYKVYDEQGKPVEGLRVNKRSTDGKHLGIVKGRYKIIQNREAFAFTDALINTGDVRYETAGSLNGGSRVWMMARMPESKILGDDVENFLVFLNSFIFWNGVQSRLVGVQSLHPDLHGGSIFKPFLETLIVVEMDVFLNGRTQGLFVLERL